MTYVVGDAVQYFSNGQGKWVPTVIASVHQNGDVVLSCKPGYLMPLREQEANLRVPPTNSARRSVPNARRVSTELRDMFMGRRKEEGPDPWSRCSSGSADGEVDTPSTSLPSTKASTRPASPRISTAFRALAKVTAPHKLGGSAWDGGEVVPGLFVGSLSAAEDEAGLREHGVTYVITVARGLKPQLAWTSPETFARVKTRIVEVEDTPSADIFVILPSVLRWIDRVMKARMSGACDAALVHCASGLSRSVTACMAWLILRKQMTAEDALAQVQVNRPAAKPNFGFMQALKLVEASEGDMEAAHRRWRRANRSANRDSVVNAFRKVAEELNTRANTLEELYWKEKPTGKFSDELRAQLEELLEDIDKAEPLRVIDDSAARSIRHTTKDKVLRFLSSMAPQRFSARKLTSVRVAPRDGSSPKDGVRRSLGSEGKSGDVNAAPATPAQTKRAWSVEPPIMLPMIENELPSSPPCSRQQAPGALLADF